MNKFLVSVPASIHTWVEAEAEEDITEDMVADALIAEYGKYPQLDVRTMGVDVFDVLDAESL